MDLGLKGKIALLTGASSGLGFITAKTLAAEGVQNRHQQPQPGTPGSR